MRSGELAAIDIPGDTCSLKDRSGKATTYVVTEKTHYNRNRRPVQRSDFKVGDAVVVHFRKSRADGALLITEMDDTASWMWLSEIRKTTAPAVVTLITDDTLSVTVGPDSVPMDYTVSDKTRWQKAGKEVDATAFKVGDHVFVVPRSLPSGSIMARAVSDSTSGAAQEKERLAASVHGVIVSVDMSAHKFVLRTLTNDIRTLLFNEETEIIRSSKPVPIGMLRAGLHVAVRIRREPDGEELAWRITAEGSKRSSPEKRRIPATKGVVTPH